MEGRSVANCSSSHALLLLPPSDRSTSQHAWLTCGTCLPHNTSPHTPKPEREKRRNLSPQLGLLQIQVHVHTASPGSMETPALTLEGSSWEVPNPVRLISLNNTNLGENGRNMPNLTCDCTFCYAQSSGEEVATRFLQAPWC